LVSWPRALASGAWSFRVSGGGPWPLELPSSPWWAQQGDVTAPCPEKRTVYVAVGVKPQPPHIRIPLRSQGFFITLVVLFWNTWPAFNTLGALAMNVAVLVTQLWIHWPSIDVFGR